MNLFSSLNNLEKVFFTKHLSMFLKAGFPLNEALQTLSEEGGKSNLGSVSASIRTQIENGQPFYKALTKESRSFDPFFVSMVEIGEVSGTLEKSLDFLVEKLAREAAMQKKIQAMLYYPAVVVAAAITIGAFISFFVLPKLGSMFQSFDVQLPLPTRVILFIANGIKNYGIFIAAFLLGILFLARFLIATWPRFRFFWHKTKLSLPFVGKVITNSALSSFFRNLGVMLSTGLSLEYALKTELKIAENLVLQKSAADLLKVVVQGRRIGEELRSQNGSVFPLLCTRMILAGEASGKLEESFLYLADFFEDEMENQAKNAAALLEPTLLIIMAIIVGFVSLAVIIPIYSLTGSISR